MPMICGEATLPGSYIVRRLPDYRRPSSSLGPGDGAVSLARRRIYHDLSLRRLPADLPELSARRFSPRQREAERDRFRPYGGRRHPISFEIETRHRITKTGETFRKPRPHQAQPNERNPRLRSRHQS